MLFCDNCKRDKQSPEPNKGVFPIGSVSPTYYILGDVVAPLEETDSIFTEQLPQYKFLMNTLVSAGLDLNSLRFFKLTRCGNILDEELEECRECCSNYCKVDIAKTNPDLIITLGAEPTKALIGSKFKSISSSRGRLYDIELYGKQFKVLPTYSPNYVVNAPDSGGLFLNDILKAKAYMDGELVDIKSKNLEYATTYEEFKAYHDKYLVSSQHPAYDLETNAHDPRSAQARMVGFSLAPDSSTGVYVVRNSLEYSMPEEDWDKVVELTKNYLSTRVPLVHNIMYEKPFTYNEWGYLIDEFDDTLVKARMLRGGDMGSASLKDQCILNLGYPDWDTDLGIYKRTFTTMLKKLKPSSAGKPKWEYDFIRDRGLCALLDEYNSMIASETSMSKNSKDLHENLEEMRDIILKYYISDTDYSCIMEIIGDELCNLVDIQYDGPFSYGFIPMKVITKYGAMDAVGTQDLDVYLNSQIDKWSKELDIDMYRGYKYIKRQFVAGVDMELNGLYWNDEIASDCDKWYLEQSQNSLLNLINSSFLDNHLLSNSAHIINEELYKNHLDYVMEVLGPFKPMKSCIKLEDGTKLSYKVILDAVNKKLGYNLQDKYKEESLELIRRIANKDKDIDRLKGFYNPGSTTQYARDLVNSILITPDIRVAHFMNRLHIMLDDPELDINTYPPSDRQLFQVLISCKEYNSKVDKYNEELDSDDRDDEILENLNHELGGDDSEEESNEPRRRVKLSDRDTFDRFMQVLQNTQVQSSKMQSIIMESLSYNLTSVSEDNIIELHRYYLLLGIDLDNPDTWTDEFKFLFNFRMYKKCMKMRSTYIQGKRVGRGKVWVTSRKGLESGELLTKRTRLYTPDISEDEAYLMQASYNVCFSGDTKVKCLDGNSYSFKELVDSGKSELWVYSKTPEGKVVPGKAKNIRMTRQNSKLVEVTLDTGHVIKCTPDHPFMLRDGTYKEAQYLTSEDSLMPLDIEEYGHKVVSVKVLEYTEDVYDLEVEGYHNFAIDIGDNQGLFVHNCGAETLRWRTGIHCLEGNTKVKLADGRDLPIKDLYREYSEGKVNYVYTVDNKGDFLIEDITEVQLSGYTNKVAKLHLDNGECIVSTQNHRYLTRLGEYKEVRDLQEGNELKSGYLSKGKCLSKSECYKVVKVELIELSEPIPVYDLSVKESTPCFLLSSGIVSHNTIPSGSDIKNIYTSRYKGGCIFAPDYSQMEIRCIAGASKCTPMLEAFKNGADIHMQNAVKIFRKPAEEILPAERRYSKMACTLGNTKIKLADGTIKSVEELYNSGKRDFYAYSFDTESKKVVPGHVVEVSMTKKVKETYKITFDNDKSVEVTDNHKFLLLSGDYVDAKDLSEGDKIETLFYRVPTKGAYAYSDRHPNYYEQIRDVRHKTLHGDRSGNVIHPRYGKWLMTHKEFYRSHYGELTLEKPNIDHQDHNSLNNDPINLRELSQSDNLISSWSKSDKDRFGLLAQAQNIVAMLLREGLELTESNFDQMMEHMYESRGHLYWRTVSKYYTFRDIVYSLASRSGYKNIDESRFEDPIKGKFKLSTIACRTVKSIEVITHEEEVPVYDLSVERYHNYAIDLGDNSGVFTHNSFMILYGGDYKNFAEEYLDGDLKLGKYIYDSFYEAYPEIKTWIDERHEQMRTTGKVTTPMDYYINVSPEKYGGSESKALRAAQNYPISNIVA